ncbi:protein-tyrosine-phosphatase [Canicola haemoglobinophilus]|uniref:protein-tyrosine-phosphatase n=1 Tax=Canicola haemoglobinophilus TaxID=733 RepID=A0A1V4B3U8_9PAST|nr:low molecular weight protein-tyrosine-phosphatase [Canicola haemoglobinophilus]OOS02042.1 protein-tyrosine-phosphatase [Canicola haemoglobinophilus]STO54064.1 low molecular weight protein-tyrosine-phosphatase [Canicola haemoglobinophilus]STO60499.1 low molecular weight protein-tyrosine-phosphatase [Canicola haemoglobinophilus]STO68597.1 low molecular weight protein-tyrosine-phosphatase [Canicola haemoglobinophilus]
MKPQINILFVCLGNICRSPMAEYIMREKIRLAHLDNQIFTDSAGTSGWHDGEDMHQGTAKMLRKYNIDNTGFISRKIHKNDWQQFDYLIAMDNNNLHDLEKFFTKAPHKLFQITTLCDDLDYDHIPDPWYTGDFQQTYQLLDKCCDALLKRIRQEHHI